MRQQAENLVQVSYQSLQDLHAGSEGYASAPEDSTDHEVSEFDSDMEKQIQVWKPEHDDTSRWLYDLVFSSYAETVAYSDTRAADKSTTSKETFENTKFSGKHPANGTTESSSGNIVALAVRQPEHMKVLSHSPVSNSSVVNELLAEYTTLTEDEIQEITVEQPDKEPNRGSKDWRKDAIRFKDAVGRTFIFPWQLSKTWPVCDEPTGE